MTARRPFGPDELPDEGVPDAELATSYAVARELEALASSSSMAPTERFTDRVMAAVAREPVPQPVSAGGRAIREGRLGALVASLADAWRVAFGSGGRPLAARAQALALVVVTVVAVGSLGGFATVGALGLLDRPGPAPTQLASPPPSLAPQPSEAPAPTPSPSPEPSDSAEPSETPEATETIGPGDHETPDPTEAHDGQTARPTDTHEPDETHEPDGTDAPGQTEDPSDSHSGSDGGSDSGSGG